MLPKPAINLRPYHPAPVPEDTAELRRYLGEELQKIAFPLTLMSTTWSPRLAASMTNPTAPLTIDVLPTPLTNYSEAGLSHHAGRFGISVDPAAGRIFANGDANDFHHVWVAASITVEIDDINKDQMLYLEIVDTATAQTFFMASEFLGSNKQDLITVAATRLLKVPGNYDLTCNLRLQDDAGTALQYLGQFGIDEVGFELDEVAP